MSAFRYTHAVVCRVPDSFQKAIGLSSPVDIEEARKQHANYAKNLRDLGLDVIELPSDEGLPDSVFVEDTAIVVNGTALITKPGHPSRRKEAEIMKVILQKELNLDIVEIKDEAACLDGGDCLFTGREFFIGISSRTNLAGAHAVASAFPEYPCTPIKVDTGLHIKSIMSMVGPDVICVSEDKAVLEVLKRIEREATFQYQILRVPERIAANCLYVNGVLLHRSADEIPKSVKVFDELVCEKRAVPMSELTKPQADMTCCSILIKKPRTIKNLQVN